MNAVPDWVSAASGSWAALPADDLLVPDKQVAGRLGVPAFTPAERLALGTLGRVISYGQSLSLIVPGGDGDTLRKALILLHRMRYDARWGWVRTPWLNARTLADRPHVIVWTKARRRFGEWLGTPGLQCFLDPATVPRANRDSHEAHTLLLDPDKDGYRLLEAVAAARISPFVILVDAESFGTSLPLDAFWLAVRQSFEDGPIVVLGGPGEVSRLDVLRQLDGHTVVLRTEDVQQWTLHEGGRHAAPAWRLLEIPDDWIDRRLTLAHDQYRTLQDLVKKDPDAQTVHWVRPVGKVLQSFRALASGLPVLETELERRARGGPFPVAPLGRWLAKAGEGACRYAETRLAGDALAATLRGMHNGLSAGQSGKAQALVEGLRHSLSRKESVRVLVGSEVEGLALEHWLSAEGWGSAIMESVDIVAMDSSRGWRRARSAVDHLWIAGTLWPNRHRWLTVPAGRITIPCYPFEKPFMARQLGAWWNQFGRASSPAGDKLRLWQLDFGAGFLGDIETTGGSSPLQEEVSGSRGDYPRSAAPFVLPFTDRHDDWMEQLLATHDPVQDDEEGAGGGIEGDHVLVYLEDRARPLAWPRHTPVQVLDRDRNTDPLKDVFPEDLKPGQQIVLTHTDGRGSILEALFRAFADDSAGLEQHLMFAGKWRDLVQETLQKLRTPAAIRRHLADAGIEVVEATVRTWVRGRVIGPENPQVIAVFAAACGWGQAAVRAGRIGNAIRAVRIERRRLGHDLRDALLARATGAEKLRIGRAELDPAALDDLLSLETVVRVEVPESRSEDANTAITASPLLTDIPGWIEDRFPGRLLFTPAALRSLKECHFRDVDLARQGLELLATRLFEIYRDGGRLQDAVMALKAAGIDFAGGTSSSTQGRSHRYDRRYKGQKVDIGAHLKLGNARDPTLTMRIHFHWDNDDRQLVIHHAGEHLPVQSS